MSDRGQSMCRSSARCNTVTMVTCPQVQTKFRRVASCWALEILYQRIVLKKKVPKLVTLYRICGSHGGQYEGYDLVVCDALQFGR